MCWVKLEFNALPPVVTSTAITSPQTSLSTRCSTQHSTGGICSSPFFVSPTVPQMSGVLDHEALVEHIEAKVRAEILAQSTNLLPQPAGHAAAGSRSGPAAGNRGGTIAGSGGAGSDHGLPGTSGNTSAPPSSYASGEVEVISAGNTASKTTSVRWSRAHHGGGSPAPVGWCAHVSYSKSPLAPPRSRLFWGCVHLRPEWSAELLD